MSKFDTSVEDVEWGEDGSDGDGSEEESEQVATPPAQTKSGAPAGGASSIGEHDIRPSQRAEAADHDTFESWKSKGDGEEFDESAENIEADTAVEATDAALEATDAKTTIDAAYTKKRPAPIDTGGVQGTAAAKAGDGKAGDDEEKMADQSEAGKDKPDEEKPVTDDTQKTEDKPDEEKPVTDDAEKKEEEDEDTKQESTVAAPEVDPPEDHAEDSQILEEDDADGVVAEVAPADAEADADSERRVSIATAPDEVDELALTASRPSVETEMPANLSRRAKVLWRLRKLKVKYAKAFEEYKVEHTLRVRIVLIPFFCCVSPCILLYISYRAYRHCLKRLCRNKKKEEEEAQAAFEEEERIRRQLKLEAGPQRSKLKPPNQFASGFARGRTTTQKQGDDDAPEEGHHHGDSKVGRTVSRDLRAAAHKKHHKAQPHTTKRGKAGEEVIEVVMDEEKTPLSQLLNPLRWPGYFRDWKEDRKIFLKKVSALLDTIAEEEEFDWDNVDEMGNPAKVNFLVPKNIRRGYRFFMLVYWDPIRDLLDQWPLALKCIRMFIRLLPCFAFCGACVWFGLSFLKNIQYVEGNCIVHRLPDGFATEGLIDEEVHSTYLVKRYYLETPERPAGVIMQECRAVVPCAKMDYGATGGYDDDRCVTFQQWKLGDQIPCYYDQDDFWGEKGTELSCLNLPSKMERETFTVAIAGMLNILICVIIGVYRWHNRDLHKQADLAAAEQAAAEAEEAAAKKAIEQAEADEALKQQEAVNRELGITEGDEEVADFLVVEMEANKDQGEGIEAERNLMRAANTNVGSNRNI